MGADLCGYMLFGPKTLEPPSDEALQPVLALLQQAHAEYDPQTADQQIDGNPSWRQKFAELGLDTNLVDSLLEDAETGEPPSLEWVRDVAERFVQMWNVEQLRDLTERVDPRDENRKVIFAGERTWGEGPHPDSAWGICETTDALGLLGILGVE